MKEPIHASIHWKLLEAIRKDNKRIRDGIDIILKERNDIDKESIDSMARKLLDYSASHLFNFTKLYAGEPLMYGVCLQKQHLDAAHYPKKLEVRNGNRPFLYRCDDA